MKDSKRVRSYGYDMADGLKVNTVNDARHLGRWTAKMTIFDRANVAIEHNGKYKKVSITGEVHRANYQKCRHVNGYKRIINRGTL